MNSNMDANPQAPGGPGISPRWTSSAKIGVGTALCAESRVWFTLSHGILDEIYYPQVDQACTRDLGLIVTDGHEFFSEEKRHSRSQVAYLMEGIPAYRLVNTCMEGKYRIEKEILTDPERDVLLQQTRFIPLKGGLGDYHVYVLLAPHLANRGYGNTAWIGDYKGTPMLFAERGSNALALACSAPWMKRSVGFVGFSDGWQDLSSHGQMIWEYERAEDGNVALTGEVGLLSDGGVFTLALGFGRNAAEAGHRALSSLLNGYEAARAGYIQTWKAWHKELPSLETAVCKKDNVYPVSVAVIRTHEAKRFPGGIIASLSVPWGFAKGDDDLGGYHLVWPRDLVEAAGALLAAGAKQDALRVLAYLRTTQEADGHWSQNMWLDGTPYWSGVQMDETAFPILLVDLVRRQGALEVEGADQFWTMVRNAAGFLVRNGPVTPQDRWEEDPGYSPFTLAVEIAALLAAADLADLQGEPGMAVYLRETADIWNEGIERWTYVEGTELAESLGVQGYYVRIAPPEEAESASPAQGFVPIKNRDPAQQEAPAAEIVSPDALALVRFGLRAADDPRILDTVRVIDALLKVDTPFGPAWHRYNEDGYGEHPDGSPFDGTGIGRAWPLLTGERAHYELARGRKREAQRLAKALAAFASEGGMLPEQIWDTKDIPDRELFFGKASGSAMPLVWAHAEYVKLCRSFQDGKVFDMPPQAVERYRDGQKPSAYIMWRFNHKLRNLPPGKKLRVEVTSPAIVRWSTDGWRSNEECETLDTGLGMYVSDLPTDVLPAGAVVVFTFYWSEEDRWEGTDYEVRCVQEVSS